MSKINTLADIKQAETSELLDLYNQLTNKDIKKFASRAKAESQTWKLIKDSAPKKPKKKRMMRFCFAPGVAKDLREPTKTSLRMVVFKLLNTEKGALFSEIQTATGWNAKNTYDGIRLVHFRTNYGMWSFEEKGDIRIRLVKEHQEYVTLISDEKKAA